MIARKHGRCILCRSSWKAGDEIQQKGGLFAHKPCMEAYRASLRALKGQV